jgi:hypothetical protein
MATMSRSRWGALVVAALGWLPPPGQAAAGDVLDKVFRGLAAPAKAVHRQPPAAGADCAVEQLASEIDWLEHHIDRFGSIVAKHPDVWGQSRLTRHRAEYEDLLKAEKGNFHEIANASLRRSDQSFLGLALAIQSGLPTTGTSTTDKKSEPTFQNVTQLISTGTSAEKSDIPLYRTAPFKTSKDGTEDFATFTLDGDGKKKDVGIGLEPTIHLDHLDRYIKHLQELRRINEGDDIADSPGYALNLVRIPVSILPGKHTQRGHGAEISVIADLQLGDDLLPTTFRNLVVNDLIDVLAPSVTYSVNESDVVALAKGEEPATTCGPVEPASLQAPQSLTRQVQTATKSAQAATRKITLTLYSSVQTRRARLPFPREQLLDVIGFHQFLRLVAAADEALRGFPTDAPCIHYTDVRAWLAEELHAAEEFLRQESQAHAWAEFCGPPVAEAIRSRRAKELADLRCRFFAGHGIDMPASECPSGICFPEDAPERPRCKTTTAVLAWMILVESTLLNERLIEDIQESATAQGRGGSEGGRWAGPFYGPNPGPEARQTFNDYVRRRWPIRVFALDPVCQEQNVEDMYAMRRETQIAMALAASSGRMNSQALMRYARRLETDLATVALNKTAVGFSHGSDTFGWRFYPRVQSPPTRNNLVNFTETLVGSNSTNRDLAERRIEPGMRECTAIVVMPSFVPYVTFDVRTNWFSLTHPKQTDQSMRQTLELSRSVKAMQQSAAMCGRCAGAYRDGEVARLLRRVEQLDRELPLQTMVAQIPYENTSGGFELFNTGVTDLAPELVGWYGAQGIDPRGETVVYLVGKGFSIHETSIIAGGKKVPTELISRQVLRATFPPGLEVRRLPGPAACEPDGCTACESTAISARGARRPPRVALVSGTVGQSARTVSHLPSPPEEQGDVAPTPPQPESSSKSGEEKTSTYTIEKILVHSEQLPGDEPVEASRPKCNALDVIDVRLATPYGVSNHLLIPVVASGGWGGGGLAFETDVEFTLFSQKTATTEAWRIGEYYEATAPELVIRAPEAFIPPEKAKLRFLLREVGGNAFATLAIAAPPYDARTGVYRLAGADLRNFVGDGTRPASDSTLRGALAPFVNHTGGEGGTFTAEATLVTEFQEQPVGGTLTVRIVHATKPEPDTPSPAAEKKP